LVFPFEVGVCHCECEYEEAFPLMACANFCRAEKSWRNAITCIFEIPDNSSGDGGNNSGDVLDKHQPGFNLANESKHVRP
jgi:hypothetical protein